MIVGHVELARGHDSLSEGVRGGLRAIDRNAQKLTGVVEDLLLFSRAEHPDHPFDPQPVDLVKVVSKVVDLARVTALRRGMTLSIDRRAQELVVPGEAAGIDRLVSNLVSNAVKYSSPGAAISITLDRSDGDATVAVADSGIGISADDQRQLFTEFFRGSNAEALKRPGTGLGLAIVARIVERHGGRIDVESTPRGRQRVPSGATDRLSVCPGSQPQRMFFAPCSMASRIRM